MTRGRVLNGALIVAVGLVVAGVVLLGGLAAGLIAGGCGLAALTFALGGGDE